MFRVLAWAWAAATSAAWVATASARLRPTREPDAADPDAGAADWDIVAGGWI
jgi:hypothetical protein